VILESLCAAAFHKDFEAVHTQTLAWMRCTWSEELGFRLEETNGIECSHSPDALAADLGALHLTPAACVSASALGPKNTSGCAAGLVAGLAVACSGSNRLRLSSAFPASRAGGLLAPLAAGAMLTAGCLRFLGGVVCDARITAVTHRATSSLALAALAVTAATTTSGRIPDVVARTLSIVHAVAIAHAGFAFAMVGAVEWLTYSGWRASLCAHPLGLWLPRISIVRASAIGGSSPDVPMP